MQTTLDELTTAPIPNSPVLMRVDRGAGGREKKECGCFWEEERKGERCFKI